MTEPVKGLAWKGYEGQDYEGFWVGAGKQYLDELEQAIVNHALTGGGAIVEIGAGFGRLGRSYVGKYLEAHMVEPATNLREIAERAYGPRVSYHEASVYDLPFPADHFDAVLMVRVFHHLDRPEAALREIHRILKPGGILLFNYSNKRNVRRIASYALGRGTNPFSGEMENYNQVLIGHAPAYVNRLLARVGLQAEQEYGVGVGDLIVGRLPMLGRLLKPSLRVSRMLALFRLAPSQFVVARKT
jgi:SAM-dependent methyltransferase